MKHYLTPSKVSKLGSEFDFQSFCYNVKNFYSAKSPYYSFSHAIMHENKSGF